MPDSRGENYTPYASSRGDSGTTAASALSAGSAVQSVANIIAANLPSRASNAADAIVPIGVIPVNATILSVNQVPASDQAGSATNFANVKVINIGSGGSGTATIGSKSFSAAGASIGSNAKGSHALGAGSAATAGDVVGVSYASAGNGIALVAHAIQIAYQTR